MPIVELYVQFYLDGAAAFAVVILPYPGHLPVTVLVSPTSSRLQMLPHYLLTEPLHSQTAFVHENLLASEAARVYSFCV